METLVIVIGLIVAAVLAFLALRKRQEPPALEAEPPPKELPEEAEAQPPEPEERPVEKAPSVRPGLRVEATAVEPPEAPVQPPAKPRRVVEPSEAVGEAKPVESKPAVSKPAVSKPVESKPVESKPADKKKEEKAAPAPAEVAEVQVEARPPRATPVSARPPAPLSKPSVAVAPPRKQDIDGLRKGLTKVREKEGFFGRLKALFVGRKEIDPHILEQIEEVLLTSDVGAKTTAALLEVIRSGMNSKELSDSDKVWEAVRQHATRILGIGGGSIVLSGQPTVVMVVGVNGSGKTTTIGKLATKLKSEGKKVVLAAGDTFRAAAAQQLLVWGSRVGCEVVRGKDGANPGAVIFDAIQKAKDTGADVVLADTAGRLHTKANLMDELAKVARTMAKALDGAPHETLLVLDATNGQNAMQQAAMFKEALPLSGIVLTKMDGTAKGGVILGICAEHNLPVRYIGIGERSEDLRDFSAEEFVEAMLGPGSENTSAAA